MDSQQDPAHGTLLNFTRQPGWEWDLRENKHTYVCLSPFAVHLKLPQHFQSAILQYKISLKFENKTKQKTTSAYNVGDKGLIPGLGKIL